MHDSTVIGKAIRHESGHRLAFAALVIGNICLAFGPWLVRLADVGPLASGFWRLALAIPLLFVATRIVRQPVPRMGGRALAGLALAGLFFAADLAAWHTGILHTKLANATLFGNVASFAFAAYGFAVARAWPGRNQGVALALALIGTALLMGRSYEVSPQNLVGDLLCILAGMFYTGYFIFVERARGAMQPLPVLLVSTIAGAAPLLLFAGIAGEQLWPENWTPLFLLAIGSQVVGQGLMVYVLGHLKPVVIGIGLLTQPVIAAVIGWIVYDERLAAGDLVGAAAIGIALVLVRRPDRARLDGNAPL